MKRMTSQEIYTKKKGGQFLNELASGDVFFSFHFNDNCLGVFIAKGEVTTSNLEKIYKGIFEYTGNTKNIEIKIIANLRLIDKVSAFFDTKGLTQIKKIEKKEKTEIVFLPEVNKVRVAVEPVAPAPRVLQEKGPRKDKYKILVVDDSKTIRNILKKIFSSDPMFEVCAMAERPSEVDVLIKKHNPDLITLDIHMPEMDGVELLKIISPKYKIPTIMISSISMAEGPLVLEALEHGAIDYIQKPEMSELEKVTPVIIEKAKMAVSSRSSIQSRTSKARRQTNEKCNLDSLIVLGSSTGGTEAIREILTGLPNDIPPMLIVQHIPAVFSAAFAKRMNDLCQFEVKEAENGDEVRKNRVLIAPGGTQMKMIHKSGKTFVEINDDEPVNRFKPSVDYLFLSVAKTVYTNTVAVILTGMGKDGAKGMLELKNKGVRTIAQDEATSVVFGMPKEAIHIGAADYIEALPDIAEKITLLTQQPAQKKMA